MLLSTLCFTALNTLECLFVLHFQWNYQARDASLTLMLLMLKYLINSLCLPFARSINFVCFKHTWMHIYFEIQFKPPSVRVASPTIIIRFATFSFFLQSFRISKIFQAVICVTRKYFCFSLQLYVLKSMRLWVKLKVTIQFSEKSKKYILHISILQGVIYQMKNMW